MVGKKDGYATNVPSSVPSTQLSAASVSNSSCTSDRRARDDQGFSVFDGERSLGFKPDKKPGYLDHRDLREV